nr:unnamed protein product [Callosobruchus chinensis]
MLFSDESRFVLVCGTMTGACYLQNIINAIVQPLRNEIGDQFIFMDDNARPHRSRAVQQALENGNIARLEWPDMNPIEHVWDYVSRAIFNRNNPPRSTQELIVAATEEWDNIPKEVINNLIIGMHRRVDAFIRSRRGNTISTEFIITFILFLFSLKILFLYFQIFPCQFQFSVKPNYYILVNKFARF